VATAQVDSEVGYETQNRHSNIRWIILLEYAIEKAIGEDGWMKD